MLRKLPTWIEKQCFAVELIKFHNNTNVSCSLVHAVLLTDLFISKVYVRIWSAFEIVWAIWWKMSRIQLSLTAVGVLNLITFSNIYADRQDSDSPQRDGKVSYQNSACICISLASFISQGKGKHALDFICFFITCVNQSFCCYRSFEYSVIVCIVVHAYTCWPN